MRRAVCVAALLLLATGAAADGRRHVVRPGESLSLIAKAELGDPGLWTELYKANRDRIKDPARIYPGQELSIPDPSGRTREAAPAPEAEAEDDG